jgi:hypothetical protein
MYRASVAVGVALWSMSIPGTADSSGDLEAERADANRVGRRILQHNVKNRYRSRAGRPQTKVPK